MEQEPFYVQLSEALEQARKEGSAILEWSGVIITLTKIDDGKTEYDS